MDKTLTENQHRMTETLAELQIAMLCRAATEMPRSPRVRRISNFAASTRGSPRPPLTAGFAGILHTDHRLCCEILQQRRSTDHPFSRGVTVEQGRQRQLVSVAREFLFADAIVEIFDQIEISLAIGDYESPLDWLDIDGGSRRGRS